MPAAPKANPPIRTLLGPGPSPVHPRVLKALSLPVVGHLDPKFLEIMDQSMAMLREVFQTKNRLALPMSGTGSAGMETCFVNLLEPGDAVLIGVNGVFGTRMVDVVQRWYLDLSMIERYWGSERLYHHTAPISMNYALHEALRLVLEEGLEVAWQRHKRVHEVFIREMRKLELEPAVAESIRAPMINAVRIPEGIDDAKVRQRLYDEFNIEIGAGLGPLKGKIWRVGLMGHGSRPDNVDLLATALKRLI